MSKAIPGKHFWRIGVMLLLAGLIFSACSLRMTYNYLDWILLWYVDDYVSLTAEQDELFDQATIELLDWHRYFELPRYKDFIISIRDAQNSPMNRRQVLTFFDEISRLWETLLKKTAPHLIYLAQQLTDEQVEQIDKTLQDKHEELQEEYESRSMQKRLQFRRERAVELFDDWLGAVTDVQLRMIEEWSKKRHDTTSAWLAYRDKWRRHLIALLKARYETNFHRNMEEFLLNSRKLYTLVQTQVAAENRLHLAQLIAVISSALSTDQRTHLQQKLAGLATEINDLMEQENK